MPTISMFYGIIIRMYIVRLESIIHHIFTHIIRITRLSLIYEAAKFHEGIYLKNKQNLYWHGRRYTKMNYWRTGSWLQKVNFLFLLNL